MARSSLCCSISRERVSEFRLRISSLGGTPRVLPTQGPWCHHVFDCSLTTFVSPPVFRTFRAPRSDSTARAPSLRGRAGHPRDPTGQLPADTIGADEDHARLRKPSDRTSQTLPVTPPDRQRPRLVATSRHTRTVVLRLNAKGMRGGWRNESCILLCCYFSLSVVLLCDNRMCVVSM